jgi:glycosyltransferase involved in cell wall biosynthesis
MIFVGSPSSVRQPHGRPAQVAVLANSLTPYRMYLHQRIVREVPEIDLWSLTTHDNAYHRWEGAAAPVEIRHVEFGRGEPTNEQPMIRYALREWRKAGRIIDWLQRHSIDAVICQGFGDVGRMRVLRWCNRHRVPCLMYGDSNIRGDNHRGLRRWLKRPIARQAVAWSDALLPCGKYGRDLFDRYGAEANQTFWFPFLPDVSLFAETPPEIVAAAGEKFSLSPGRRRILFSARMMPVKRPDLAVRAFCAIAHERPEWDLLMVGDGPLRKETERLAPQLARRVHWLGFVHDMKELAGVYAQSDLLLLPSDKEPWGVVVVEAAAAGLAIVASDVVGATPELVKADRNGVTFAAGDLSGLTAALRHATDPQQIDRFKAESPHVLREWIGWADPVEGLRRALRYCGVLSEGLCEVPAVGLAASNGDPVFAGSIHDIGGR